MWLWACPICRQPMRASDDAGRRMYCPSCGREYPCVDGVWRMLPLERLKVFQQFIQEYEAVRRAEGRGSSDPAYYRALPERDLSGRWQRDWAIRARSYAALVKWVIIPLEQNQERALKILDLGAGNGWLSGRLAQRGHELAAVDLLTNAWDGLGAHIHYSVHFTPVQAEFDCLPFAEDQADLVIFNASFHYSVDYRRSLGEALRVLKAKGKVVILDSPWYSNGQSGEQMVREREAQFLKRYSFPSNALPSRNYLTEERLIDMAQHYDLRWRKVAPFYGIRWAFRPWLAQLRRHREPAQFYIWVGERSTLD